MGRGCLAGWLLVAACATLGAGSLSAAGFADIVPLEIDAAGITRLATSPNGQTVYGIDESRRTVVAIDPFGGGRRRDVVAPATEGRPHPVSLAALPGDIVAVVCRSAEDWSLQTYRARPGEPADAALPLQEVLLGRADGPETVAMAASRIRGWFAVAGLPPPLPPVTRVAFAGPGVRRRPDEPWAGGAASRPIAVAIGPADELVTIEAAAGDGTASLVSKGHGGRELLRLDIGLADVRGVAFARDGSSLWVIAGAAAGPDPQPAGLWRLDAVFRDDRQAVQPTCIVPLDDPQALAAVSDRSLVVVHGSQPRTISRIEVIVDSVVNPKDDQREEGER
jgi:hypothetical protein